MRLIKKKIMEDVSRNNKIQDRLRNRIYGRVRFQLGERVYGLVWNQLREKIKFNLKSNSK